MCTVCGVYSVWCVQCVVCTVCGVYRVMCTVCGVYRVMCTVCGVYRVMCTVCGVYSVWCVQSDVYSVWCIQCVVCTVCVECTLSGMSVHVLYVFNCGCPQDDTLVKSLEISLPGHQMACGSTYHLPLTLVHERCSTAILLLEPIHQGSLLLEVSLQTTHSKWKEVCHVYMHRI